MSNYYIIIIIIINIIRIWARIWSLGDNLVPLAKILGDIFIFRGTEICTPFCWCKEVCLLRFLTKIAEHRLRPFHSTTTCDLVIFFGFLRSSSVSSWSIHCSSSVSFFSDSLWLWFGAKQLSNVRTRFRCDMLTIARRVHNAWLEAVREWNVCVQ